MSYIGGLQKAEFTALIADTIKPFLEETKALRAEITDLKAKLQTQQKELYTIEDLEKLFTVGRATIHNWVNEGKLIKHKMGGRTFFKSEDVNRIIELSKTKK